jgi:hypothetical protein
MVATEATTRLLVGDPAGASQYLTTADYTAIIALETNEYRAAAAAARSIAAILADKVTIAVGPLKLELTHKYKNFIDLAGRYDFRAEGGGGGGVIAAPEITGISLDAMYDEDSDDDRVPSRFKVGMFDNPVSVYTNSDDNDLLGGA